MEFHVVDEGSETDPRNAGDENPRPLGPFRPSPKTNPERIAKPRAYPDNFPTAPS
jgi:hypothetical protein